VKKKPGRPQSERVAAMLKMIGEPRKDGTPHTVYSAARALGVNMTHAYRVAKLHQK